jgi:hypothetical protein
MKKDFYKQHTKFLSSPINALHTIAMVIAIIRPITVTPFYNTHEIFLKKIEWEMK